MTTTELVEKETALVLLPQTKAEDVFVKGTGIDELIAAATEKALAVTIYADNAKGREEIRAMAYLVTRTKTAVEAVGKGITDKYKEVPKVIDGNRKKFKDAFDALHARVRKPLTDWEEAEKTRVQEIKNLIAAIHSYAGVDSNSEIIAFNIQIVETTAVDEASFAEFAAEAQAAKDSVLARLYAAKDAALKREAEQAELDRLRAEKAAREQVEREARIAAEATAKATREADIRAAHEKADLENQALRARLAQEQAEKATAQAKADSELKAKAAVEAEQRRVADAAAMETAAASKREVDNGHRFRVAAEAVADLQAIGITKDKAVEVVYAIRDGNIRNLFVKY